MTVRIYLVWKVPCRVRGSFQDSDSSGTCRRRPGGWDWAPPAGGQVVPRQESPLPRGDPAVGAAWCGGPWGVSTRVRQKQKEERKYPPASGSEWLRGRVAVEI